ncbi:hypothetical protein NQ315_008915 [Exocentrus adspersus]|uniref:DUF7041 domain-containing protein n=1 Tax=Exocentrus adspersus TaxID=1586481 RepID=A0AAV8VC38_9CUCU|nr:hypothetical protein NQ315_008915 [Exocentrus adspersus]
MASDILGTTKQGRVQVPPFWPERPAIWFAQLEGQFELAGITADKTKFYYVTSNLDQKAALEVEDIITTPPATGKYQKIKDEICKRLSVSQEQRIRQLLEGEEIGDRTPSQFLRHLRNLAGSSSIVPDDFLRTIWVSRLPRTMQAILATQDSADLNKVAELADKIKETNSCGQIAPLNWQTKSKKPTRVDK